MMQSRYIPLNFEVSHNWPLLYRDQVAPFVPLGKHAHLNTVLGHSNIFAIHNDCRLTIWYM